MTTSSPSDGKRADRWTDTEAEIRAVLVRGVSLRPGASPMPTLSSKLQSARASRTEIRREIRNALTRVDRMVERAGSGKWSSENDDQRARVAARDIESALLRLATVGRTIASLDG